MHPAFTMIHVDNVDENYHRKLITHQPSSNYRLPCKHDFTPHHHGGLLSQGLCLGCFREVCTWCNNCTRHRLGYVARSRDCQRPMRRWRVSRKFIVAVVVGYGLISSCIWHCILFDDQIYTPRTRWIHVYNNIFTL